MTLISISDRPKLQMSPPSLSGDDANACFIDGENPHHVIDVQASKKFDLLAIKPAEAPSPLRVFPRSSLALAFGIPEAYLRLAYNARFRKLPLIRGRERRERGVI